MLFASSPLLFSFRLLLLLLLLLLLCGDFVLGEGVTIATPKELIDFANSVNSGTSYSSTTVYLGSDLEFTPDLSSSFEPIGKPSTYPFQGTFDGKGYVISNLTLTSSSLQYVGLFGYSNGAIIKNVVLDASCSFVNSYSTAPSVGSVIGYCDICTIENVVNIASVTFTGNIKPFNSAHLGGIVGSLVSSSSIRNCVNYGSVTHLGTVLDIMRIGGIVGICTGDDSTKSVHNCANYGTITHNGTTSNNLYMGGITGNAFAGTVVIENCVSAGKILNLISASVNNHIGSVVGYIYTATNITHCLRTSDVGYDTAYGYSSSESRITYSSLTELNTTTMNELNTYAEAGSWDKWFMLHLNGGTISNDISQETLIVIQKYFPNPVKEGRTFLCWCTDTECTGKYNPETTDITGITDLYAMYTSVVTFDFGNGTNTTRIVTYGEKYGELPDTIEREGYTFNGWFTEEDGNGEEISSDTTVTIINDHTLYAHWLPNNYTLTLNFGNGTEAKKNVTYGKMYGELPDVEESGYTFNGWFTGPTDGDKVEPTSIVNTSDHHIIYPHWAINQYTITFKANGGNACENITQDYGTSIELPTPKKTGYTFSCWCSDSDLTNVFEKSTIPAENVTLYAKWDINNYSLIFTFNNGENDEVRILNYSDTIIYPNEPVKEGYTFNGWDNNITTMPSHNIIITAQWTINNYTLTFIFNNSQGDEVRILNYSDTIIYPNDPVREGYNFNGWDINITIMPSCNLNITAQWTKNGTTNSIPGFVEIVLGKKDLSDEDIKEIIKEYTDVDFTIEKIVTDDEAGGIKVIIRFADKEVAENFVENVKATSNVDTKKNIISVNFIKDRINSFSSSLSLVSYISFFL